MRRIFGMLLIFLISFCGGSEVSNNDTLISSTATTVADPTSTSSTTFAPFSTTFSQTITIPTTTTSTTVYIQINPVTTVTTATEPLTTLSTTTTVPQTTIDVVVTVGSGSSGQSVYLLNGSQNTILNVVSGNKYRFNQSDSSNSNHPLRFSATQEGTEYSTNVISSGVPGNSGSYVEIEITSNTPNKLYLICLNHFGMGGNSEIVKN